jgi:exoribonuclease R
VRRSATALLRGSRYTAFDAEGGVAVPADCGHAGIGGPYAHVTAPLRRLVDRFGSELCLALAAGAAVPDRLRAALVALPEEVGATDAVAGRVARACLDRTTAAVLAGRVGTEFDAVVLRPSGRDQPGEVFVADPPVVARSSATPQAGRTARVRLVQADPATGRIAFAGVAAS